MFILLVRGLTLPGSKDGIVYYLYPDFTKLTHSTVRLHLFPRRWKHHNTDGHMWRPGQPSVAEAHHTL